jgi:hypothetical protein
MPTRSDEPTPEKKPAHVIGVHELLHEINKKTQEIGNTIEKKQLKPTALSTALTELHKQLAQEFTKLSKNPNWTQGNNTGGIRAQLQTEVNDFCNRTERLLLNDPSVKQALQALHARQLALRQTNASTPTPSSSSLNSNNQINNPASNPQLQALAPTIAMVFLLRNKAQGPANSWDPDFDNFMTNAKNNLEQNINLMLQDVLQEEEIIAETVKGEDNTTQVTEEEQEEQEEKEEKEEKEQKEGETQTQALAQEQGQAPTQTPSSAPNTKEEKEEENSTPIAKHTEHLIGKRMGKLERILLRKLVSVKREGPEPEPKRMSPTPSPATGG